MIDTTAEIESVTLVTDSGDSDVDNITKVDKPQFSIVTADDITHVRVKIDNAANWIELTKGGDGRWIFNVGSALPDGKHTLLVDVTDIAGNVAQETLQFTIDTTLREPTIVLDPTHDTGDDTNDNLTRLTNRCLLSVMSIMMYHTLWFILMVGITPLKTQGEFNLYAGSTAV